MSDAQSTDLVAELRDYIDNVDDVRLRVTAADEIERLRGALERIKVPEYCSLQGLSDAHTLGYWMGLSKGFENLARQALDAKHVDVTGDGK